MREILFRGKRTDSYNDTEGFFASYKGRAYIIEMVNELVVNWHEVIPESVSEYTGIKDKNSKRIFEGDIIKVKFEGFTWSNMRVDFKQGAFCLVHGEYNRLYKFNGLAPSVSLEVIGNIHDNPELIQEVD